MIYRILTLNDISPRGLARLLRVRYEVGAPASRPGAILGRSAALRGFEVAPGVRAIGRAGAGGNNIPVADMSRRGIPVFNTPGANANAVKELVLAGLLLAARNIAPAWLFARQLAGDDEAIEAAAEKGKKNFVGFELPGRTLAVVGLGAIGVEVANSALALGMRVLGYDPQLTVQRAWQLSSSVEQALSLEDLFTRADAITVHVPLNEHTQALVNGARLALAKRNVPNMVGQISTCLAGRGINIADLLNKSRGEFAYTLIDADGAVGEDLLASIRAIGGVLSARIV